MEMPRIKYQEISFRPATLALIETCNRVIAEYERQGFTLTLRQLYYQMVSRDVIPNRVQEYKRLGSIVNDARLAGLIDWEAIEDRTRNLRSIAHWRNPAEIVEAVASQFRIDKWAGQKYRVEVWIEKDALVGVIEGVCEELDVPFFSCRGYTSQSEMWGAAMRMARFTKGKQIPVVLHLGDHDPSGIDMTRDIQDRLRLFSGRAVEVDRLALNMPQVEEYDPPPNPAKESDSRFQGYMAIHGDESWELDALEPTVIAALIRTAVEERRNPILWAEAVRAEDRHRKQLQAASDQWDELVEQLEVPDDEEDPEAD
jgi:hypothetical protein